MTKERPGRHLASPGRNDGNLMKHVFAAILIAGAILGAGTAPAEEPARPPAASYGVVVMSHGGAPEWNATVEEMVAPLRQRWPVEIAWGMADAATLEAAVRRLEQAGVRHIGVVRLFVWGESFLPRTRQALGLEPGAPARPADAPAAGEAKSEHPHHGGTDHPNGGHGAHAGGERLLGPRELADHMAGVPFWRIETKTPLALSREGLAESALMGEVLRERVAALSREPARESVLLLAHGPADDAENARWLAALERHAQTLRTAFPFRAVRAATLREDWPDKREAAIADVRAFVAGAATDGGTALVVPCRVSGFGPYAEVFEGLEYRADKRGLAPHPNVTRWIAEQAERLEAELRAPAGASPE